MINGHLGFVIVGTSRSGTTLVQRLATDLPGVAVPPETHFFSHFAPHLVRRVTFPLQGRALAEAVEAYRSVPIAGDLDIAVADIVARLGGRCPTLFHLFGAVVETLAGPCDVAGEKTPEHLSWWRPMSEALPGLRFVAVVRDPRAVVASNLAVPFGMDHVDVLAERWRADQRAVLAGARALGPDRVLILRYEDVVVDPHGARASLARFIGVDEPGVPGLGAVSTGGRLFQDWETWKDGVRGPITPDRIDGWRDVLDAGDVSRVLAICGPVMADVGYHGGMDRWSAARAQVGFGARRQFRRAHYRLARYRHGQLVARSGR